MQLMQIRGNNKNVRLLVRSLTNKFGKLTIYAVSDYLHKHPRIRETYELAFNVKIAV